MPHPFHELTYGEQTGWALAVQWFGIKLRNHRTWQHDPCQDRGVDWPCDVERALREAMPGDD